MKYTDLSFSCHPRESGDLGFLQQATWIPACAGMTKPRIRERGFTLIELIIFLVVIGIAAATILVPLSLTTERSSNPNYQTIALGLAQQRMELILAQRNLAGYSSFTDPCTSSSLTICQSTQLSNYNVNATVTSLTIGADSGYKKIVITVTGPGYATLTALVGNY